jgi:hypothetical protein
VTEFRVIDFLAHHNPQPDAQLASSRHARFPHSFLHQLAAIETPQFRIAANRLWRRFSAKKTNPMQASPGREGYRLRRTSFHHTCVRHRAGSACPDCTVCGKQCVSPPFIHSKSCMRKRARTDLRGGRSAMVVPTATTIQKRGSRRYRSDVEIGASGCHPCR